MAKMPPLIMKLALPVSPYPTFPRTREKGQTKRYATFTLKHILQANMRGAPEDKNEFFKTISWRYCGSGSLRLHLHNKTRSIGMRLMWYALGIAASVYGGLSLLLFVFQASLIFYPETDREVTATPALSGLQYEDIHLKTSDGISLHGWYTPAPQPRGTVLFLHGNAGNISHRLDSLAMFHRLGYSTLIFDYRGYGNSSGTPTEQGTYLDAETAWRYLTEQRHIPTGRIVLFGESLGGAVAAWLAARQKPAALVIASGFTSVPDLGQQLYPYLPVRLLTHIRYDTREYLRSVTVPVLIAHSPQDDIIPFEHGRSLYAAANPPKQFLELAGGHNDGFIFMRESWIKALEDFLGDSLEDPPGRQTDAAASTRFRTTSIILK